MPPTPRKIHEKMYGICPIYFWSGDRPGRLSFHRYTRENYSRPILRTFFFDRNVSEKCPPKLSENHPKSIPKHSPSDPRHVQKYKKYKTYQKSNLRGAGIEPTTAGLGGRRPNHWANPALEIRPQTDFLCFKNTGTDGGCGAKAHPSPKMCLFGGLLGSFVKKRQI